MTEDFTSADMAAMGKQGDRRAFLTSLMRPTRKPETAAAAPTRQEPDHRPGAWPAGTQPPGPLPAQPEGAWDTAIAEYRDRNRHNPGARYTDQRCECGCDPDAKEPSP